ncbi:hypothetical protein RhiirA4_489081 [Rhizophagus irregularis]|uniref:Uncharacterized protein n=1 Tax=Rhizophagus irregularis TaxID=588596 RepID=A0A2I1HUF5_9GLOM|nr:hypothetical protein RhiirA4_489081 [Rhizophagus irregularis]
MKKKRIKYLAIINFTTDLFSFKDEVKEFELYNIKIQKYRDLVVKYKLKFLFDNVYNYQKFKEC